MHSLGWCRYGMTSVRPMGSRAPGESRPFAATSAATVVWFRRASEYKVSPFTTTCTARGVAAATPVETTLGTGRVRTRPMGSTASAEPRPFAATSASTVV